MWPRSVAKVLPEGTSITCMERSEIQCEDVRLDNYTQVNNQIHLKKGKLSMKQTIKYAFRIPFYP